MTKKFGELIRQSRKDKGYSQSELAKLVPLDVTYLSKLENHRAAYPPKEDVIRSLARSLDLDEEELIFLAGRMPERYEETLKQHYKTMPDLFRRLDQDREYREEVERGEIQAESEGEQN